MNSRDYEVKDSGKREEMTTGAQRDTREGKGRFDLLPARAMARIAVHFEKGSAKYGDRNWEKGMPISRLLDSSMRHLFKYLQGESDEDHLVSAAWNLLCALEIEARCRALVLPLALLDVGPPLELGKEG